MTAVELIRKKRDGGSLTDAELDFFFTGYLRGKLPDYQAAAMLMAMFFHPLSPPELAALCRLMTKSGKVLDLSGVPAVKVDKHSTGGVGDKTSLILAPVVASLGVAVPMVSGRGLGHTGGTLDKLESIPGFDVNLSERRFISQLQSLGCALIGQTKDVAPLDKLLYALRDATGTVESIPLIASSIMSKKIASGLDALVLDVKTGRGAFMQSRKDSDELARTLLRIGEDAGKKVRAFITEMSEPMGYAVGNWVEVKECIEILQGRNDALVADTLEVSLALAGEMLVLGKKAKRLEEGIELAAAQLQNGKAFDKFVQIVRAQNGEVGVIKNVSTYPKSTRREVVTATESGHIKSIDALEVGLVAVQLGAGRAQKEFAVEPKAGILFSKKVGDKVLKGETVLEFFTDRKGATDAVKARLEKAVEISVKKISKRKKVLTRFG